MYIIKKEYSYLFEDYVYNIYKLTDFGNLFVNYFTTEESAKRCVKEIEREEEKQWIIKK